MFAVIITVDEDQNIVSYRITDLADEYAARYLEAKEVIQQVEREIFEYTGAGRLR